MAKSIKKKITHLGEVASTAISGNDITSSCLYVSALAIIYAGQYAWISLLMVAGVLFLFRKIYGEVVGALPLNGGAYNALLNTTRKSMASLAAALTLLSYMATAVISASEAMHYAHGLMDFWPVIPATIGLLAIFMTLTIIGIGESSKVAIGIFAFHLISLLALTGFCFYYLITHGFEVFMANNSMPTENGVMIALFFGFSAAMLGISGFESSANFVEEQAQGVFPKTLRNMWIIVSIFNPLMAFLALAILPQAEVVDHQETLLSHMGLLSGGPWLALLVSVDAVLVLSGAVLTSFVGVTGLIERMTLDRVLPQFLLRKNSRGVSYRISIAFFVLCTSILLITQAQLGALAGVYTIAFLSVMALFGIGNILLKLKRRDLPRPERAGWGSVLLAISAVILAVLGNAILNPPYLVVFLEYFIPTVIVIVIMLNRVMLLRTTIGIVRYIFDPIERYVGRLNQRLLRAINRINSAEFVFFTKHGDIAKLNKVMLYIQQNEHTRKLKIVSILKKDEHYPEQLKKDVEVLNREYPKIQIELLEEEGVFGPEIIQELSEKWNIPVNFMFIGSPDKNFPYRLEELGGVRLII